MAVVEISNIDELQAVNNDVTADYVLVSDIDASATVDWNSGAGFVPLGIFTGTLDGNGFVVDGLYIDQAVSGTTLTGPFGRTEGTISNLGFTNVDISGGRSAGFASQIRGGGLVENCYSTGTVSGTQERVGGFVGNVLDNNTVVRNCFSYCSVASTANRVGGFCGRVENDISIINCYSTGTVSGTTDVGGFLGNLGAGGPTITSCYWDTQTSGQATSAGGTGKTTAEMQQIATYVDWDFAATWYMPTDAYPVLQTFYQVRDLEFQQTGQETYRLTWSGRSVTWYVYQDGLFVSETQVPFYDLDIMAGDSVQIDVLGLPTQSPALAFPSRVRLQWDSVAGADHYLIEEAATAYDYEYDDWQQVGRVDTPVQNASTHAWLSGHKPDGVYHYRVTAVSPLQAPSDPVYMRVTVAATPRMPDVQYSYEYGTLTVT